jgi:hypothetical protein
MSSIAASTRGINRDNIRNIVIQQTAINPMTTTFGNPFGNTILYQFPNAQSFMQCEVAIGNLYMFYSWFNITAAFGNNTFSYLWPNSGGTLTTYNVTIPDGYYSLDDLNAYFEGVQLQNGTYLYAGSGAAETMTPVYFLTWASNSSAYRTTLTSLLLPTAAGEAAAGYNTPANYAPAAGGALPPVAANPELVILPANAAAGTVTPGQYSFSKTLGFSPGTYPPGNTGAFYNINGQFPPVIESTSNVLVSCNMVLANGLSRFPQVLYTLSPTVAFGSQIQEKPFFPLFMQVADGSYDSIVIQIQDENGLPLNMQDPHINLILFVRGGGGA